MKHVTLPPSDDGHGEHERRAMEQATRKLRAVPSHLLIQFCEAQIHRGNFGGGIWVAREHDRRMDFVRRVVGGGNL